MFSSSTAKRFRSIAIALVITFATNYAISQATMSGPTAPPPPIPAIDRSGPTAPPPPIPAIDRSGPTAPEPPRP